MFTLGPHGGAASYQTLGRVVGAYLFVGFHFAWVTWMYRTGSQKLGWWNPSELLFHPDALATYLPWLTSVANSLHAGVWEECLFRALPLAGAALMGTRYGKRWAWIAGAFALQIVIFGAAHASYPTQPSYARIVELIMPSAVFGGMYLAFGLLPGIIMHFTYDVVLFAMPVFLSAGAAATSSQVFIVVLSLLPLWVVLWARISAGQWHELPAALYNGAWTPSEAPLPGAPTHAKQKTASSEPTKAPLTLAQRRALIGLGVLGFALWVGLTSFGSQAPVFKQSRSEAIALARQALEARGVKLGQEWQPLAAIDGSPGEEEDFVWRVSGEDTYRALLGSYLEPPLWRIRFVKFEGDIVERAEEHQVFIQGSGEVFRVRHELPEARSGLSLEEDAARKIAVQALKERYALDPSRLKPVLSNQFQLPARRDWIFAWKDPSTSLKRGEARVAVKIAGEEVVGARRYVHVPEDWLRTERGRKTAMSVAKMVSGTLFLLLFAALGLGAFRDLIRGQFNRGVFLTALGVAAIFQVTLKFNEFTIAEAYFTTAQPWMSQFLGVLISSGLVAFGGSAMLAVFLGRIHARAVDAENSPISVPPSLALWEGYAGGAWLAALAAGAAWFGKAEHPVWPSFGVAASRIPPLEALQGVIGYVGGAAFLLLLYPWVDRHCTTLARKLSLFALLGISVGTFMAESTLLELVGSGAAVGLAFFIVGELIKRTAVTVLIPLSATVVILQAARVAVIQAYPGAFAYGVLLAFSVALASWYWLTRGFGRNKTLLENDAHR